MKKKVVAAVVGVVLVGGLFAGCAGSTSPASAPAEPTAQVGTAAPAPAPAPVEEGTVGQRNALKKAESYLQFQSFSKPGLIKQLEFDKFPPLDATWAVEKLTVDWNEQAVKKAKDYLSYQAFSHDGLVQQLIFEGFTPAEAEHGVVTAGL